MKESDMPQYRSNPAVSRLPLNMGVLRRSPRFALSLSARLRLPGGPGEPVLMTDLSEHGCRIECWGLSVARGDAVILRPEGMEPVCGTVCWIKGAMIGISFTRALYGPVVEHLARRFGPAEELKLAA
jgi:hypothetical protein